MRHILNKISSVALLTLVLIPHLSLAQEYEVDYDRIVRELSQNSTRSNYNALDSNDPFANILFHAGVNFSTSHINIQLPEGESLGGFHNGVEFSFGIDLFSRNWIAEGTVRSYGDTTIKKSTVSLKEFDLKIINRSHLSRTLVMNTAFGLGARYIDFRYIPQADEIQNSAEGPETNVTQYQYKTPASLFSIGIHAFFTDTLSLGADLSYRNSLISESIDKNSIDVALKIDTHF